MQIEDNLITQYVLQKHHLLEGSQVESVLQVVNDIIALHATSVGVPYLSLFARVRNFQRNQLDEEFYLKRNLVRLELMRGTLFVVLTDLAPMIFQATRISESQIRKAVEKWGVYADEYEKLAEKLYDVLSRDGKTIHEIKGNLPRNIVRSVILKSGMQVYRSTNVGIVLQALTRLGVVVSEKDPGALSIIKGNRFSLLKEKYPHLNLNSITKEDARVTLVRSYIKAFGPVAETDIVWWTGFSMTEVKQALAKIEEEILSVKIRGFKRNYLMLKEDYEAFSYFRPLTKPSIALLPYEDPYTKGYKIRDRLIDSSLEKRVYVGGGVQPTILLDGKIIGIWNRSIEEGKGPIKLKFFSRVSEEVEREFVEKAKAIGKLMSTYDVNVEIFYEKL
ncbi:MAG: winged helix DNA-binding domain-containing protein [Candidatus Bathyarchaeia archaeon]